jgi:hypothetical protein
MTLGDKSRRLIVAVELYRRAHGVPPTWRELRAALELDDARLPHLMHSLRDRGALTYDDKPRSLRLTRAGLDAALARPTTPSPANAGRKEHR